MNPLIHNHLIPARISVEILDENSCPLKEFKFLAQGLYHQEMAKF